MTAKMAEQAAFPPHSTRQVAYKCGHDALAPTPSRGSTVVQFLDLFGALTPMAGPFAYLAAFRRPALALTAAAVIAFPLAAPALARGPDAISDVAEQVIDAVVNISTTQTVAGEKPGTAVAASAARIAVRGILQGVLQEPPPAGREQSRRPAAPRDSLGSGFMIDASGLVVTNNHVIADADEITVVFNDSKKLKAELVGRDRDRPRAVAREPDKPLKAVNSAIGEAAARRMGDRDRQPVRPGGSVTAGIVSARNRDIDSGPYDDYIQTDAAQSRQFGRAVVRHGGKMIGIDTAIFSPSGGSIGIAFSIPATPALA